MPDFSLEIRTPVERVASLTLIALRVPTETGQAGVRPRMEASLLALVPGLVLLHSSEGVRFCATAGGLLDVASSVAKLYTPYAVLGDEPATVLSALDEALARPTGDLAARRRLAELEQRIVRELRAPLTGKGRRGHG
ncbi:MAG: hypothetical protein KC766_25895 [Myxococcales bacterium]|nr:hypothetical protein [Myxococcales bacterium]